MQLLKMMKFALLLVFLCGTVVFAQSDSKPLTMEPFVNDLAMGVPVQDIYIDAGLVVRPTGEFTEEMLAQPVFNSTENHAADFSKPFEVGPFTKADPLGFTLGEWLATSGTGTYTVSGDRATFDLQFENLVPEGVYTLWCLQLGSGGTVMAPCGAPDGSEGVFTADSEGKGEWMLEIDAYPPATDEKFYEVALAYHSDGQTYGESPGEFGRNVHVPIWSDILPEHNGLAVIEMVFINETGMGIPGLPIQDVYIDANLVVRPKGELTAEMLEQPVYSVPFDNPPDFFEEPFDVGPYEKGEALGFTLGEWLAATGTGTYMVDGEHATMDLSFENLVPNGVYTLWCVEINPTAAEMSEAPCGAPDGSENQFVADAEGNGAITIEINPLPESTEDLIQEIGLAYHSDGQTYGESAGEFGKNIHVQLVYDFLPPDAE